MSKLLDRIRGMSAHHGPSLGFGASMSPKRRTMVLLAQLARPDAGLAGKVASQGVDGVLFPLRSPGGETETVRQIAQTVGNLPWGVRLEDATPGALSSLAESGCDFVVVDSTTPLGLLREEKPGKVLDVDPSLPDSLLRAVDQLPVEITLLASGEDKLTVQDLMGYWRIAALVRKPLILATPTDLEPADLALLREVGVQGLSVAIGPEGATEHLNAFRKAIEELPAVSRPRGREEVRLPMGSLTPPRHPPGEADQ